MSRQSIRQGAVAAFLVLSSNSFAAETASPGGAQDPGKSPQSIVKPGKPHGQRDPHRALPPETHLRIALQHKTEGRPHEAINTLSNALMSYDTDAQLYAVRGSLYLEQGRVTNALRDLEASLRLDPDNTAALTNRAQAYRGFGRADEALADLNRAVELDPDLIPARFNRGVMFYERGKMEEALADFNHCIAVDPHAAGPYFNRAAVYDAMDRRQEAVADINRFMELTDNENWKKSAQDILKAWADKDKAAREAKDS